MRRLTLNKIASVAMRLNLRRQVVLGAEIPAETGTVVVGRETHLGVGVSVRNNLTLGARSVVGVGAAVVADLPDDVVAVGVPARVVRRR